MQNNGRVAAIWCRVSTHDQRESSLDSQEVAVRRVLEAHGYSTPPHYVLKVDWTSLDLMACPQFQRLRRWIASGEAHAVGVLDRDRLQAQGLQRLIFLSECQENGVQVITAQGVPMLEGAEGQLVELALALGKERSVMRAQQGARDGLRDRAALRGLPATPLAPYGYRWNGKGFEPDPTTVTTARRIWDMALEGVPLRRIASTLMRSGIPSPSGRPQWGTSTLAGILSNPTYRGQYIALRSQRVEPRTRLGATYGKSTHKPRDEREHVSLPGLVTEALVTSEEYARVQERLARNKAQGGKVVQSYLLRGLLRCESCGRRWRGKVYRSTGRVYYRYICNGTDGRESGIRCDSGSMNGQRLEGRIWERVVAFLTTPEVFLTAVEGQQQGQREAAERVKASIDRLEKRLARLQDAEARAYSGYVRGMASEETYRRVVAELRAERAWIGEEMERQRKALGDAQRMVVSADAIRSLYPVLVERIKRATFDDKRFVLECLDTQVTVVESGVSLSLAVPESAMSAVSTTPGRAGRE